MPELTSELRRAAESVAACGRGMNPEAAEFAMVPLAALHRLDDTLETALRHLAEQPEEEYVVSYSGGPLDNTGGTTATLAPIQSGRGEYRFLEFGTAGGAVFEWNETGYEGLQAAVQRLLDRARRGIDADEEDLEKALDAGHFYSSTQPAEEGKRCSALGPGLEVCQRSAGHEGDHCAPTGFSSLDLRTWPSTQPKESAEGGLTVTLDPLLVEDIEAALDEVDPGARERFRAALRGRA